MLYNLSRTAGLPTARTVDEVRQVVTEWRAEGHTVGLVPTMGALHAGHLSLVELAQPQTDRIIASVFVNPTQFGEGEDFSTYPRDEVRDAQKLARVGADLLYAPDATEMYPEGFATQVFVVGLTDVLCGANRPGHFDGVATVVTKLLTQVRPDVAVFGEKDWQQLATIRRLAIDLDLGVNIVGGPIVREADGLAMSSRNAYLTHAERKTAAYLNRVLYAAAKLIRDGKPIQNTLNAAHGRLIAVGFQDIDYFDLRDEATLEPIDILDTAALKSGRLFVAAHLGNARLIDNLRLSSGI